MTKLVLSIRDPNVNKISFDFQIVSLLRFKCRVSDFIMLVFFNIMRFSKNVNGADGVFSGAKLYRHVKTVKLVVESPRGLSGRDNQSSRARSRALGC